MPSRQPAGSPGYFLTSAAAHLAVVGTLLATSLSAAPPQFGSLVLPRDVASYVSTTIDDCFWSID
jgi:hypothetical protein